MCARDPASERARHEHRATGRLEDELGLTLLVRSSKGVELTPAGLEFIAAEYLLC